MLFVYIEKIDSEHRSIPLSEMNVVVAESRTASG